MSCFKGDSDSFFAVILVHETSHGFIHRYKSTIHIPPWINEGIADWVAGTVVGKLDDEVRRRQFDAVDDIRTVGHARRQLLRRRRRSHRRQYGTASSLVEILLRIDGKKYRKLIDNIRKGSTAKRRCATPTASAFSNSFGATAHWPAFRTSALARPNPSSAAAGSGEHEFLLAVEGNEPSPCGAARAARAPGFCRCRIPDAARPCLGGKVGRHAGLRRGSRAVRRPDLRRSARREAGESLPVRPFGAGAANEADGSNEMSSSPVDLVLGRLRRRLFDVAS